MAGARGRQFAKTGTSPNLYEVTSPSGAKFMPPPGRCWARTEDAFKALDAENRLWWGPAGDRTPRLKMFLTEADDAVFATTLWARGEDGGSNQDGIREISALGLTFATPKPETLRGQIPHLATNPGHLHRDPLPRPRNPPAAAH